MYCLNLGHGPAVMSTQIIANGPQLLPAPPGAVASRECPGHGSGHYRSGVGRLGVCAHRRRDLR